MRLLTEAPKAQYLQMFNVYPVAHIRDHGARLVDWARQHLKREDRIIWYLRFARIGIGIQWLHEPNRHESPEQVQVVQKIVDKLILDMERRGLSRVDVRYSAEYTARRQGMAFLSHIVSMENQIPKIGSTVWGNQSYNVLETELQRYELEWEREQSENSRFLPPTDEYSERGKSYPNAEPIIRFPDGFTWWNLNVTHCEVEGDAMGHCGNAATADNDETVLSLRQRVERNGKKFDVPHLTFILNTYTGQLGEMKGRSNNKPATKYHPYIMALLRNDLIKGIVGGGYAPHQNFQLTDLPHKDFERLVQEKPTLASFEEMLQKYGYGEPLLEFSKKKFGVIGLPTDQMEIVTIQGEPYVRVLKDFDIRKVAFGGTLFSTILSIVARAAPTRYGENDVDQDVMVDVFREMEPRVLRGLLRRVGFNDNDLEMRLIGTPRAPRVVADAALRNDPLQNIVKRAFTEIRKTENKPDRLHKALRILVNSLVKRYVGIGMGSFTGVKVQKDNPTVFDFFLTWDIIRDIMRNDDEARHGLTMNSFTQRSGTAEWIFVGHVVDRIIGEIFEAITNRGDGLNTMSAGAIFNQIEIYSDVLIPFIQNDIREFYQKKKAGDKLTVAPGGIDREDIARAIVWLERFVRNSSEREDVDMEDLLRRAGITR